MTVSGSSYWVSVSPIQLVMAVIQLVSGPDTVVGVMLLTFTGHCARDVFVNRRRDLAVSALVNSSHRQGVELTVTMTVLSFRAPMVRLNCRWTKKP